MADWRPKLMTARELGELLISAGDVPVKLRLFDQRNPGAGQDDLTVTMVERDGLVASLKSASGTEWGDIPQVLRLDIQVVDNA